MKLSRESSDSEVLNEAVEFLLAERSPRHCCALQHPWLCRLVHMAQLLRGARDAILAPDVRAYQGDIADVR